MTRSARAVALATVYTVGVFALLEAATRAIGLHAPALGTADTTRALWAYDATLGWSHRANAVGVDFRGGPDRGIAHINSLGIRREGEVAIPKPADVLRVVVLGDSFAFGVGVDDAHVFTSRLEQLLNARTLAGPRYEVLNLAVSGYSTDQELLLWRQLGPRLEPDLVVLVVCDNDFSGNTEDFEYGAYYKPYFDLGQDLRLQLRNVPVPTLTRLQQTKLWLAQHSNAWNLFRATGAGLFQVATARTDPDEGHQVRLTAALVEAMGDGVKELGARFLVVNAARHGENARLFRRLAKRLEEDGGPVLSLDEPLKKPRREAQARGERWAFGPDDPHWNVPAHQAVAGVLYPIVSELSRK